MLCSGRPAGLAGAGMPCRSRLVPPCCQRRMFVTPEVEAAAFEQQGEVRRLFPGIIDNVRPVRRIVLQRGLP